MALTPDGRFVLEEGDENATIAEAQPSMLQESERDIVYFQEFFLGQRTQTPRRRGRGSVPSRCVRDRSPSGQALLGRWSRCAVHCSAAHATFLAADSPVGPVSVSLVASPTEYKAIFRTAKARDGSDDVGASRTPPLEADRGGHGRV